MNKRIKEYEIYPIGFSFTPLSKYYNGIYYIVAAKSIKQAYFLAGNRKWCNPNKDKDVGIIEIYNKHQFPNDRMRCTDVYNLNEDEDKKEEVVITIQPIVKKIVLPKGQLTLFDIQTKQQEVQNGICNIQ